MRLTKWLRGAVAALFLAALPVAQAAITVDSTASGDTNNNAIPNGVQMTITIGTANTDLYVGIGTDDNTADYTSGLTITADGNAMTFVAKTTTGSGRWRALYHYRGLATGSRVINVTNTLFTTNLAGIQINGIALVGADPTTPVRNSSSALGTGLTGTVGVTSQVGDLVLGFTSFNNADTGTVTGAGTGTQTILVQHAEAGLVSGAIISQAGAAGTVNTVWADAGGGSSTWGATAVSIAPAATGTTITPSAGSLAFTGSTPTVTTTSNRVLAPTATSMAFTGFQPTVTVGGNKVLASGSATFSFTGSAPTIGTTAFTWYQLPLPGGYDSNSILAGQVYQTGSILRVVTDFTHITANYATGPLQNDINDYSTAASGYTGTDTATYQIKNTSGTTSNYTVNVNIDNNSLIGFTAGSMAFTGNAATLNLGTLIVPSAASMSFVGATPSITVTNKQSFLPGAAALAITPSTPFVAVTTNATLQAGAASMAITGTTPSISNGQNISITGQPAAMHLTGSTPTVALSGNVTVAPLAGALHFVGSVPTIAVAPVSSYKPWFNHPTTHRTR